MEDDRDKREEEVSRVEGEDANGQTDSETGEEAGAEATAEGSGKKSKKKGEGTRASLFDVQVYLVSTKPLLMSQYEKVKMVDDLIYKKRRVVDTESDLPTRAAQTIHRDGEGRIAIPTLSVLSCLCAAGCKVNYKGRSNLSKEDGKVSEVPNFLEALEGEYVPLLRHDGTPLTDDDWVVDVKRGQLKDGTACALVRARFDQWAFRFHCRVDLTKLQGLQLRHVRLLFEVAGNSRGLGAFRKFFGRFTVAEGGWLVTEVDPTIIPRPKAPAGLMQVPEGMRAVETA